MVVRIIIGAVSHLQSWTVAAVCNGLNITNYKKAIIRDYK